MSEAKTQLEHRERVFTLLRYPERANEPFQAWDAGDEYIINHVEELGLESGRRVLILNDNFGALSCWFADFHKVTTLSDSYISHLAIKRNIERNKTANITLLDSLSDVHAPFDLVLIQLPKNNRFLIWQLSLLRKMLSSDSRVIAVNKAKDIHSSTLKLFEKYLGTTTTSLAWKKHRLVLSCADSSSSFPLYPITEWPVDGENFCLKNLPNTYSGESLDLGARFMLQHLPKLPPNSDVIDLGCGNGVLSVKIGQLNPDANITCVDESYMAVESARQNLHSVLGTERQCRFVVNNCLDGFDKTCADLVVCNPPFHQHNTITDHIAWQMFCDAKHVLRSKGQLMVIGNRHLGYDAKLTRLFGRSQVKTVASNSKFVILQAIKQ